MSETSRYLLVERRLRRSAGQTAPPCLTGPAGEPDDWTGTADRLRPEDAVPPAAAVAVASSLPTTVRSFDDGARIDLRYDGAACRQPQQPQPAAASPAPSPAPVAPPQPQPAPAREPAASPDDDAAFAQQLRELVETAGAPPAAVPATPAPAARPAPAAEPEPAAEDRYGVFDRIGEALASPRTFDLGSVPVTAAFDAIERAMERPVTRRPAPTPPLGRMDMVEDLAAMPAARATSEPPFIGYTPGTPDALMIDQRAMPAPTGVTVRNWGDPSVAQFTASSTRAAADVRQIVIHETATPKWEGIAKKDLGVQMHLERDGTLIQHNDVLDMLWHVKTFSPHAVGIETVSIVFDKDDQPNAGEVEPGERIPIAWGGKHGTHYVVPPLVQMEALAQTVQALRHDLGIPDNWLQVMEHPDAALAAGAKKGSWYFLMTTAGHKYFDAVDDPWIASHSVLRDHEDGAFPTLYCYLRLHKAMTPDDAYQMAKQVVEDPGGVRRETYFDATTKAPLQLLDITDLV